MLIGRNKEIELLDNATRDDESHFIAIYGRRRVGKTYLVKETFANRFTFEHTGLSKGNMDKQLHAFELSLINAGYRPSKQINSWIDAFNGLRELILKSSEKKKILFIDELSWMDTRKSDLIVALEHFYNSFVVGRKDIVLIICSSATSWVLKKVIHNKGGLYNRLTEQINLKAFSLKECEEYIRERGLVFTRNQILQCYMIFGGIPYYWSLLKRGLSLSQNIDELLFSNSSPLKNEYQYLYASIFRNPETYMKIIEALSKNKAGLTREEIASEIDSYNNGNLADKLDELEACDFIKKYNNFMMKKNGAIYQLIDNYTLFYFHFIKDNPNDEHFWSNQINTPRINTWLGLAFEKVCFNHINRIKEKLGISGVLTKTCAWRCKKDLDNGIFGSQIDLLIIRNDNVINLCEIKYSLAEYIPNEEFEKDIQRKRSDLQTTTRTKYAICPTLITNYGLIYNPYSNIIQSVVLADDLFR